jgi:hypothetical protein
MDPYQILGISPDANADEIRRAYRKMAAQHHPDAGGKAWIFQQIHDAYDMLKDSDEQVPSQPPRPQTKKRRPTPQAKPDPPRRKPQAQQQPQQPIDLPPLPLEPELPLDGDFANPAQPQTPLYRNAAPTQKRAATRRAPLPRQTASKSKPRPKRKLNTKSNRQNDQFMKLAFLTLISFVLLTLVVVGAMFAISKGNFLDQFKEPDIVAESNEFLTPKDDNSEPATTTAPANVDSNNSVFAVEPDKRFVGNWGETYEWSLVNVSALEKTDSLKLVVLRDGQFSPEFNVETGNITWALDDSIPLGEHFFEVQVADARFGAIVNRLKFKIVVFR